MSVRPYLQLLRGVRCSKGASVSVWRDVAVAQLNKTAAALWWGYVMGLMQKAAEVDWWCFSPTLTPSSSFSDCQCSHALPGLSTPAVFWQPPLCHCTLVVLVAYPRGAPVSVMLTVVHNYEARLPSCVVRIHLSAQKTKANRGVYMEAIYCLCTLNKSFHTSHSNLWIVLFNGMVTYGFLISFTFYLM